jgi:hypothetical protein
MASKTIIVDVPADLAAFIAASQTSPDYTLKGEPIYKLTADILKQYVNAELLKEYNTVKAREEAHIKYTIDSCAYDMKPGPARDEFAAMMRNMMTNKPIRRY